VRGAALPGDYWDAARPLLNSLLKKRQLRRPFASGLRANNPEHRHPASPCEKRRQEGSVIPRERTDVGIEALEQKQTPRRVGLPGPKTPDFRLFKKYRSPPGTRQRLLPSEPPYIRIAPSLDTEHGVRCGYKVVLTGEGADEFLAGYDIF